MSRGKPNSAALQKQCDEFNSRVSVGAAVTVRLDGGEVRETTTRSYAEVLSGHTPVIWLEGIRGCYLLDRVTTTPAAGAAS